MKATAFAPVNVAPIKYWGKIDETLRLPANSSLSVNLTKMGTTTTVEWKKELKKDVVSGTSPERVIEHLNRIRSLAKINLRARVATKNNFPESAGLSSSASGFAALTLAATAAAELKLSEKDLSRLARLGSGSACRSIPDGWVEWIKGKNDFTSYARTIFPVNHWDLRILVVLLSQQEKKVSSTDGQAVAATSAFFKERIKGIDQKIINIKQAIKEKNFRAMGEIMEEECLNMHSVMLTSKPSLIYWLPETVRVMQAVREWREAGLESYFTINTGQNVFVFCRPQDEVELTQKLSHLRGVIEVKRERIGLGARIVSCA